MAKILTVEIDTAQLRVAEVDSRGQHIYHCFVLPVPQGAIDDGQIRDTKSLGNLLKEELIAQGIKTKKVWLVLQGLPAGRSVFRLSGKTGSRVSFRKMQRIIFQSIFPGMYFPTA